MSREFKKTRGEPIGSGYDKTGRMVEAFIEKDVEGENRGFVTHRVSAWVEDLFLGHVDIAYVDKDAYAEHNPTEFHHMSNFGGHGHTKKHVLISQSPPSYETYPIDITADGDEDALEARKSVIHHLVGWGSEKHHETITRYEDFLKLARSTRRYKENMGKIKEFMSFHFENPYVGYSMVRDSDHKGIVEDSRGKGVGTLLYAACAHAMRADGLSFSASSLRSPEADRLWAGFEEKGWTEPSEKGDRTRLVSERIPSSVLDPVGRFSLEDTDLSPGP